MAPFKLIWSDISNNVLTEAWLPINFPGQTSPAKQLQLKSNAAELQTFETLKNVKFFLTGDTDALNIVQNVWPGLGPVSRPELNGGVEISFDFGRTYTRFDSTHGVEALPETWIPLPVEAVGAAGSAETLGAFDVAHLIVRYVIPPGANQFQRFDISLALDFDII